MKNNVAEKVVCETPTPGKKPTRIDKWKYDLVRAAILKALPRTGRGVAFKELAGHVRQHITDTELNTLGALGWYTTTVKLDLEAKGEIRRVPGVTPQHLLKN